MVKLDFSKKLAAQDMIKIVMKEKGLSVKEAIDFSINHEIYQSILKAGYASIALDLWGHGGPVRKWEKPDNPVIEIEFDKLKERLVDEIAEKEEVDTVTAISYFLLFTMASLGYHI